jgi:hypothetical protein
MAETPVQRLRREPPEHEQDGAEREPEGKAFEAEHDEPVPRRIVKRTISFLHLDGG